MFGTQHTLKQLFGGIAIAAFLAVVAVPSAFAGSFITDTLGGNGYPATKPSSYNPGAYVNGGMSPEVAKSIQTHRYDPAAYVNGGATPAVAQAIQDLGNGVTSSAPSVTGGSSGTSFNWGDAGIGAGLAAGLLLLLAWGARLRTHNRRGVLTV